MSNSISFKRYLVSPAWPIVTNSRKYSGTILIWIFNKLLTLYAYLKIKPTKRGTWWEKRIFSLIMYIHSLSFIIYLIAMILLSTGWLSCFLMLIHLFYCTINAEVLTLGTSLISNFLHAYHVYRCHSILCKLFVSFIFKPFTTQTVDIGATF